MGDDVDSPGEALGTGETHDHVQFDKADRFDSDSGASGPADTEAFEWDGSLESSASLFAAIIVPPSVWASTGRVTAAMSVEVDHSLTLSGEATPGHGAGQACAGHGACECKPAFTLELDGPTARLTLDIGTRTLDRPPIDVRSPEKEYVWDVGGAILTDPFGQP